METESRNILSRVDEILRRKQLSVTESRRSILQLFTEHEDALAHGDIEKSTGGKYDRVTVYRTLQTFVEKGIIHTIPTSDNSVRYALCRDCTEGHHHDEHVHFVCNSCGKTYCLDDVVSPGVNLPHGFSATEVQVVIHGECRECAGG